jgi:hypothetical protein
MGMALRFDAGMAWGYRGMNFLNVFLRTIRANDDSTHDIGKCITVDSSITGYGLPPR